MGGVCSITCAQSQCTANVEFHCKVRASHLLTWTWCSIKRRTHSSMKVPPVVTVICVLSLTAILWWQEALGHCWGPVSGMSQILMATYRAAINYTFSHIDMWLTRSHSWGWRESGMEWWILSTLMGYVSLAAIAELFCKPPTHTHIPHI